MSSVGVKVEAVVFEIYARKILRVHRVISQDTEKRRFRASFGTDPAICSKLWTELLRFHKLPEGGRPLHLLWGLMFLKLYCAESVNSALAGGVDEKTFRKWAWAFAHAIASLELHIIDFDNRFKRARSTDCMITIDGTDFAIYEKKPFWSGWFSHKFKGPGLRYEIGVSIYNGDVVWFNGPFPCGAWPDIKIFRSCLRDILLGGEKVEADDGYRGERNFVNLPKDLNAARYEKAAARARHETLNRRLKQWGCLNRKFRHAVTNHVIVFKAVLVITPISIENGHPLFDVEYNSYC